MWGVVLDGLEAQIVLDSEPIWVLEVIRPLEAEWLSDGRIEYNPIVRDPADGRWVLEEIAQLGVRSVADTAR